MSYQSVDAGSTERFFTVVNKSTGNAITSGTVNYYLIAQSGENAGKYYRNSNSTWVATELANPMTHEADGHWEIDLHDSPFADGVRYLEFVRESGDLHVPDSRHLVASYPVSVDSLGRVSIATSSSVVDPTAEIAKIRKILNNGIRSATVDGQTVQFDHAMLRKRLRELEGVNDPRQRPRIMRMDISGH